MAEERVSPCNVAINPTEVSLGGGFIRFTHEYASLLKGNGKLLEALYPLKAFFEGKRSSLFNSFLKSINDAR